MSKTKLIHPHIWSLTDDDIRQAGYTYLQTLLHKVSILTASQELRVTTPTIYRVIDDNIDLEKVSVMLASHIIFMCETTTRLIEILDSKPRNNACYEHVRHVRLAARKANGKEAIK